MMLLFTIPSTPKSLNPEPDYLKFNNPFGGSAVEPSATLYWFMRIASQQGADILVGKIDAVVLYRIPKRTIPDSHFIIGWLGARYIGKMDAVNLWIPLER